MVCTGCGIICADACHERPARPTVTRTLMQRSDAVILLFLALAALQGALLAIALRTGRARGRYGTIIREKEPCRFWRYVNSAYVVLLLCACVILWALISPASFH